LPDTARTGDIALKDLSPRQLHHAEAPYQVFLAAALLLALLGGFMLATLLPIARALEWDWGTRWQELGQAHGQLQLMGFAGLFIAGMAFRLMPRFSGRPLAYPLAVRSVVLLIGGGVGLRSLAPLLDNGVFHGSLVISGAVMLLGGSIAFAAVIMRTLVHPESKAEATSWFFVLGAGAFVVAGSLDVILTVRGINGGMRMLPLGENNSLVSIELYGFVLMFIGGIATRAVTTLVGRPRSQLAARIAAAALGTGAASHTGATLVSAIDGPSPNLDRMANVALLIIAMALLLIAWATRIFHPRANRVAAASQAQFWFVRAAFVWLVVSSLLLVWYASAALADGKTLDQFEADAVRHMLTIGVVMMMIVGMAMLVVPEFAGRRLQHPHERGVPWAMFIAINLAAALRVWPALEGIDWLSSGRYWPMAAAGVLATTAVAAFAFMFGQSYLEQRRQNWASLEALGRRSTPRT
jgi:hypothetical protein